MDTTDLALVKMLMSDSRESYRKLASKLGLSMTAVHKRIKGLRDEGAIQEFTCVLNPALFDALQVIIFGRAGTGELEAAISEIGGSEFTSKIIAAGGNDLYITAYLSSLSELEDYAGFVKNAARMPEAVIGIVNPLEFAEPGSFNHSNTDFQIVRALRHDSRRSYSDVADELGVTAKTIRRRLDRMLANHAVQMSIDFIPESTSDIFGIFNIYLKEGVDAKQTYPLLINKYSPNLMAVTAFTNITDLLVCSLWGSTMKEIRELHEALMDEAPVKALVHNIYYTTQVYSTWMDKLVQDRAVSQEPVVKGLKGKGKGKSVTTKRKKKNSRFDLNTLTELEAYRRALVQALMDGVITSDEEAILKSLRDSLDISETEHNEIFKMIRLKKRDNLKELETYRRALAQALEDGIITGDEQAILEALRDALEISEEYHDKLLKGMKPQKK